MMRIGVQFEKLSRANAHQLEQFVFEAMTDQARKRRHVRGLPPQVRSAGAERRDTWRVSFRGGEIQISVSVLEKETSEHRQNHELFGPERLNHDTCRSYELYDLSATGCSYICQDAEAPKPGKPISLRLMGSGVHFDLQGIVVHCKKISFIRFFSRSN